ncbi:MAG: YraN family protein [Blastocatellales bacterium]
MNFIAPIGHTRSGRILTGEIDLIAYDTSVYPQMLTFIEVKTRRREIFAAPESAVDKRKREKIIRTARVYRRILGLSGAPCRFDVVSIIAPDNQNFEIRLFKGFFEIGSITEPF